MTGSVTGYGDGCGRRCGLAGVAIVSLCVMSRGLRRLICDGGTLRREDSQGAHSVLTGWRQAGAVPWNWAIGRQGIGHDAVTAAGDGDGSYTLARNQPHCHRVVQIAGRVSNDGGDGERG